MQINAPLALLVLAALVTVGFVVWLAVRYGPPGGASPHATSDPSTTAMSGLNRVDYALEDRRDEWKIFEVAFLWHDLEPPGTYAHFNAAPPAVDATRRRLHDAIDAGQLATSRREETTDNYTRWVTREALRAYCASTGEQPGFLFARARAR